MGWTADAPTQTQEKMKLKLQNKERVKKTIKRMTLMQRRNRPGHQQRVPARTGFPTRSVREGNDIGEKRAFIMELLPCSDKDEDKEERRRRADHLAWVSRKQNAMLRDMLSSESSEQDEEERKVKEKANLSKRKMGEIKT